METTHQEEKRFQNSPSSSMCAPAGLGQRQKHRLTAGENEANAYGEAPRELGLRAAPSSADCGVPEHPSVRKLREFLLHFSENENILKNGIIFELVIL